jgi:hypothetical protein
VPGQQRVGAVFAESFAVACRAVNPEAAGVVEGAVGGAVVQIAAHQPKGFLVALSGIPGGPPRLVGFLIANRIVLAVFADDSLVHLDAICVLAEAAVAGSTGEEAHDCCKIEAAGHPAACQSVVSCGELCQLVAARVGWAAINVLMNEPPLLTEGGV